MTMDPYVRWLLHGPELPLAVETAEVVLGLGLTVFAIIAYDLYRQFKA